MFRFDLDRLRVRPAGAFAVERDVHVQEVDAAGIVFFARLLEYASDAFAAFCNARGVDLAGALRLRRWGAPIRHVEADYFLPLVFGDRVEIALVAAHVAETRATLGYRVARLGDGEVTTLIQVLHVFVDATFARRSPPEELRVALAPYCGPQND
jgi:1,4-dihydroxy-2-naphthoyl-CoA hydrolase